MSAGSVPLRATGGLVSAFAPMLAIWTILIVGGALAPVLSLERAVVLVFGLATASALVWIPLRPGRAELLAIGIGVLAGYVSLPAWSSGIQVLGGALGLLPRTGSAPGADGLGWWLASVLLAPVFEELVYRERLLLALRERAGAGLALGLSSSLYAIPHLEAWNVLGTLLVGLGLGAVRLGGGRIGLCIGIHAGLNLAILACGAPPVRGCLGPGAAAIAGSGVLALALWWGAEARTSRIHPGARSAGAGR